MATSIPISKYIKVGRTVSVNVNDDFSLHGRIMCISDDGALVQVRGADDHSVTWYPIGQIRKVRPARSQMGRTIGRLRKKQLKLSKQRETRAAAADTDMVAWTLRLPRDLNSKLTQMARNAGRSTNKQVMMLIREAILRSM
jgi:hypothetical protein